MPGISRKDYKYILGIQCFATQDSGAAMVRFSTDGAVLDTVAISEERLIRKKFPYTFPVHSIAYCMDYYGLDTLSQVDLLVGDHIRLKRWIRSGPSYNTSEFDYLKLKLDMDPGRIITISHHMAHAASVFYTSGFDHSAILVVDGNGSDLQTTSFLEGDEKGIRYLDSYKAQGIGAVYSAVTSQILNLGTGGEGKTMGLAPYGEIYPPVLTGLEGKFNGIRNDYSEFMRRMPYSDILNQLDPKNRINPIRVPHQKCLNPADLLNPYFSRVAFEVQQETERALTHLGQVLWEQTHSKNLCLSGGVALNSVANKVCFDATPFEKIHVFPACSDAGIPFGLAIWGYYNTISRFGTFPRKPLIFNNAYTGREYDMDATRSMLEAHGIPFQVTTPHSVAQELANGKIIGWFQGGSEYGPRALGHRSILADSRRSEMRDFVNTKVKHRETFRPFAPAILAEQCAEYFDIEGESPFMLLVASSRKTDIVPAVTHVDNTARVQTVTQVGNGIFYDLIQAFFTITGVPCILNTSFNDAGEPIVETPEDALICFLRTEMDLLVIGPYLIHGNGVNKREVADRLAAARTQRIEENYQKALKRFFPDYDSHERDRYIAESNKDAQWRVVHRSRYELEKTAWRWKRDQKRILIVGTRDHTALLPRRILEFSDITVVGFVDFNNRLEGNADCQVSYPHQPWNVVIKGDYDEILVSSFEFMYDITEALLQAGVKKPIYEIYDNASRSFLDTLGWMPELPRIGS